MASSAVSAAAAVSPRERSRRSRATTASASAQRRFNTSTAVLGMPANRHWVLLANQGDKSLLRNETAFEISRRMGYTKEST